MRQLWLTSFAGVVLVVLFFEASQASVVAVEPVNQPVNTTAGLFDVVPVNAGLNTVSVGPKSTCCVTSIDRKDYKLTPGVGAHKLVQAAVTWNAARDACFRDGAQLAEINSYAEEELFRSWLDTYYLGGIWIGVHDMFEHGSWVTMTGEPLGAMKYYPFAKNRPNNSQNREHCGVLWKDPARGIDDCPCQWQYSFVCEINLC